MSSFQVTYDEVQHCTALQKAKNKSVASDSCTASGGRGEELSPGELVGAGLASCMLFSMGFLALRDGIDIRGTRVTVDISLGEDRIESVTLEFVMPQDYSDVERRKLEKAASTCPIKRSFLPDVEISTHYNYPKHASTS